MKASRSIILSVVMLCLCFMNIEIVHASSDDVTSKSDMSFPSLVNGV